LAEREARSNQHDPSGNPAPAAYQHEPGGNPAPAPNQHDPDTPPTGPPQEEEDRQDGGERRPVVYRAGKLPKDLPPWWAELDTDQDGQIGLYEWRLGGKALEEFAEMDLNGDGLLTAEEYLKYAKLAKESGGKIPSLADTLVSADAGPRRPANLGLDERQRAASVPRQR